MTRLRWTEHGQVQERTFPTRRRADRFATVLLLCGVRAAFI